jgi:hypothetical protein
MLGGKEQPIKKMWAMPICDERIVETFLQFQCGKSHAHETAEGSQTDQTGFYTLQFCTSNP